MSTSPTSTTPTRMPTVIRPAPLIARVFGEARFHTDGDVAALAFQTDGSLLTIDEAGVLRQWSDQGRLTRRAFLSDLETLWCFNPGGTQLTSASDDLLFWEVNSGILRTRVSQPSWVTALAYSTDGSILASGHDSGLLRFWDAAKHEVVNEIPAHPAPISAIAISHDNQRVATACEDRVIRVWSIKEQKLLHELKSHTDRISSLCWNADGSVLISAGWDRSARVWDFRQDQPVMLLNSHSDLVHLVAYSPDGKFLATADSDQDIYLWSNPSTATVAHKLSGHVDEIRTLAFSPDGTKLASAGAERVIYLWDVQTGKLLVGPNPAGRNNVAVVPSGESMRLASTGDSTFRLWDVQTGDELPPSGESAAYSVAASPDGSLLAVGGVDITARLYDFRETPYSVQKLEATKPPIGALAINAQKSLVAHASPSDGLVWLWTPGVPEAKLILIEAGDGCTLESLVFLPNGEQLVVGGIDYLSTGARTGAVCIWDMATQKKHTIFDVGVYSVAVDPSGRYLAGTGINDAIYIWDLTTEDQIFELPGHQGRIQGLTFSPDGSYLVSGGDDMTIRVWDLLSGRLLMVREFDHAIHSLAFSPDGKWLFSGNSNTTCFQIDFRRFMTE